MEFIISEKQLKSLIEEAKEPPMSVIQKLFKVLDEEKKKKKKRAELLEVIEKLAPYMNISPEYALYLLELYVLNFRKDGDYSGLTKDNFVDPRKMKGKVISNPKAKLYTVAQMPFKGSNLEGYWSTDPKGNPYYKVTSYDWYPVYIFKDDKWYETVERYSSSTSRQMSNANPVKWDDELNDEVYTLTKDEMKMLENGYSHDEVMKHKLNKLKELEPELTKRKKTARTYRWWGDEEDAYPDSNIKYKIKSVDLDGDKALITIDVYDVVLRKDNKEVPTFPNYARGEMKGMNQERAEEKIKVKVRGDLKNYMKARFRYNGEDPKVTNVEFKFNHLKK